MVKKSGNRGRFAILGGDRKDKELFRLLRVSLGKLNNSSGVVRKS